MTDKPELIDALVSGADDSFDALLKRAAHVSGPKVANLGVQLHPGSTLLDGRLKIQRRIGEGGMGVVYAAFDEQRRGTVALKTLNRLDAANVYRLKNEFRSLADVSHPNLCRLHELFGDLLGERAQWFFTMELIDGERFDEHVRVDGDLDEARLRAVLPQLVDGIDAIHNAGKLHRDLKPSNVLVARDGRVVILDFGLAMESELGGVGHTVRETSVSGTPGYMAPEQAAGQPATTASDYYALGAMLFEALTGKLPFEGRVHEMLVDKQRNDAPSASSVSPTAPPDLAALCAQCLSRDASQRPDAKQARQAVGAATPKRDAIAHHASTPARDALVGRDQELAQLRAAYARSVAGEPVVVFVVGESGMGKSALVNAFLDELRAEGVAAVLAGRCYERESVPFKAFDAVVDELSRYLRKQGHDEASALLPREVSALARLFPVLDRVEAVSRAPKKDIPDPRELQVRAFAAFGELLARIRDRRPLVVHVDDLQWADQDSAALMGYLMAHREPVPLLMVASHRIEGAEHSPLLQQMVRSAGNSPLIVTYRLEVAPLSGDAALQLVGHLLRGAATTHAEAVAHESQGSPFFARELVRQLRVSGVGPTQLTLHQAVLQHVASLGSGARDLLETLAVAGRPLPVHVALGAAETPHSTADMLLAEHLLRASGGANERTLECYHDKIRETAVSALEAQRLAHLHRRLALTLAADITADPKHLAMHWHGAGDSVRAAVEYERAGDASTGALAFDHAAQQYAQALALSAGDGAILRALQIKLAAALAAAGHGRQAAHKYRAAAEGASPEQALDLTREAARLLMTSGYADEGRVLVREVFSAIGMSLPTSRRAALFSALWSRARLKLRGLALHEPATREVNVHTERHLEALWAVVQGSMGTDPFLMVDTLAQYTRRALDAGSHVHVVRALTSECYLVSFDGAGTEPQTEALIARVTTLAAPLARPEPMGWVHTVAGAVLCDQGHFQRGRVQLARASTWLQERCTSVQFDLSATRIYDQIAASTRGDLAELAASNPLVVEDALHRDDMFSTTMLGAGWVTAASLAVHGLDETYAHFDAVKARYQPQSTYQWPDVFRLLSALTIALYQRNPTAGVELAAAQWTALERSQLMRLQIAQAAVVYGYAGCALASLRGSTTSHDRDHAVVRRGIRMLRAVRLGYAPGFAAVLEAGLAMVRGDGVRAIERLRSAAKCFEAHDLRMHGAAARRRLGQLIGGDEGRTVVAQGNLILQAATVMDLESTTEMLIPGCHRSPT